MDKYAPNIFISVTINIIVIITAIVHIKNIIFINIHAQKSKLEQNSCTNKIEYFSIIVANMTDPIQVISTCASGSQKKVGNEGTFIKIIISKQITSITLM